MIDPIQNQISHVQLHSPIHKLAHKTLNPQALSAKITKYKN